VISFGNYEIYYSYFKTLIYELHLLRPEEKYTGLYKDGKPDDWIDPSGIPREEGDQWSNGDKFRFYITTRRLIEFSTNFKLIIQTDGTYKLTWIGNSILIVGASDFDRVFHPIGLACCSREAQ